MAICKLNRKKPSYQIWSATQKNELLHKKYPPSIPHRTSAFTFTQYA